MSYHITPHNGRDGRRVTISFEGSNDATYVLGIDNGDTIFTLKSYISQNLGNFPPYNFIGIVYNGNGPNGNDLYEFLDSTPLDNDTLDLYQNRTVTRRSYDEEYTENRLVNVGSIANDNVSLTVKYTDNGQRGLYWNVSFSGAVFINYNLANRTFTDVNFNGTNFTGATISDCTFIRCDFTGANFTDVVFDDTEIYDCNFTDALCIRTRFMGCRITSSNFNGTDFLNAIVFQYDHPTDIDYWFHPHYENSVLSSINTPAEWIIMNRMLNPTL